MGKGLWFMNDTGNLMDEIKDPKDIKGDAEEYNPRKKREIIKNILIIFLAVLLVLTFFSNTIMNKSLPEITTESVTSGKLTERIRGSGLVEANQSYGVTVDGNKTIDTIMVKTGQEVEKGDVLFTVGTGESEELTQAEENLAALELEYNKLLLTPSADYTSENQAIKNAREDLADAIAKRDNALSNQENVNAEKENYKYNKSQVNYYTKIQTKLTAVIAAVDSDDYMTAPAEYTGQLIQLKNELDTAESEYNTAKDIYTSMLTGEETTEDVVTQDEMGADFSQEEIDSAKAEMDEKEQAYNAAKENYDSTKFSLRQEWSQELVDAENNIDYYTSLVDDYESENGGTEVSLDELNNDVTAKQRALEDLIAQLQKAQKEESDQDKIDALDVKAKKNEIEKAKKKVNELKKKNETTEITSKYSGVVSAVNAKAGDETIPDMEIITMDISSEGYTVQITVDGEKTKKIKKGATAEVINNWNGDVEAVLMDIRNDTTPNSKNRILVFSVTGDIESGTNLDLSIPCGSGSYDAVVPKSAVHSDNDGTFVLTVKSKSSPLGNRYYTQKIPVDVIVSDELSSAVSGDIYSGDYIITASSAPISDGDQVRMSDK